MKYILSGFFLTAVFFSAFAQNNNSYWQQEVDYKMNVQMDVKTFQYKGTQELKYTNNSPDTLNKVFYHLYFNAFQPGSERSEEHTSELQSRENLVCRLLLEKK